MANICTYTYDPNILTQRKVNDQFSLIHKHLCYVEATVSSGSGNIVANSITTTQDGTFNTITVGAGGGGNATNDTAVGYLALANNTTGGNNTAVGYNALNANTIGNYNTAIGWNTLATAQNSNFNTAIGFNAMNANNNTAYQNVAVGSASLYQITTGEWNVAIGHGALENLTTGVNNIVLGSTGQVGLNYLQTGNNNTYVGANIEALSQITSGNYNTLLGANITIGTNVSNTVALADGQGHLRVYSPSSGNVLINTTTDNGAKLQVAGSMTATTVTFPAGTTTVAPIVLTAGTNLTAPVNGAFEFDGTHLYFTIAGTRHTLI